MREKYSPKGTRNLYSKREFPFLSALSNTRNVTTRLHKIYGQSSNGTSEDGGEGWEVARKPAKNQSETWISFSQKSQIRAASVVSDLLMCWSPAVHPPAESCVWADRRRRRTSLRSAAETSSSCLCSTAARCPGRPSWSSELRTGQDETMIKGRKRKYKF